jgi:hypothetical protein
MSDNRTAKKASALLSSTGYLRLSSDLVPDRDGPIFIFVVTPMPQEKKLKLRIIFIDSVVRDDERLALRNALYANDSSKCPLVAVKSAMKFLGIQLPEKSKEFPVKKRGDVLTVQF